MTTPQGFDGIFSAAQEALASGAFARAAQLFAQCTQLQPQHPASWFLRGVSLDRCGNRLGAAQAFSRAEMLDASHPQAANALATMLSLLGRRPEALAAFRRALALNPGDAQILTNIGIINEALGSTDDAQASYDAALASDPDHLGALSNRGAFLLLKLKRPQQALIDYLHFVACAPDNPIGHYNCAETYAALGREEEALLSCEEALARDPDHMKALFLRGALLSAAGRFAEAVAVWNKAGRIDPEKFASMLTAATLDPGQPCAINTRNTYCLRALERLLACDWRDYTRFVADLEQMAHAAAESPEAAVNHIGIPFASLALPLSSSAQLGLARLVAATIAKNHPPAAHLPPQGNPQGRLRIGYVSPDFQDHAVGYLLRGFFRLHDRNAFSIHAYSLQPGADSSVRREIIEGCEIFRDVAGMTVQDITELIRRDGIDILVDLSGYTAHSRPEIFASRPAPLNILYLGYPGTSGADYMDYFVTNPVASPRPQASSYTEKMIYLPDNCFPYPQDQAIGPARDRQSYGLPQDAFVFCCFSHSYKIEPVIFATWMRLLQRVPDSVLWLYAPQPTVAENLCAEAAAQGVDPARLVFAPLLPLAEHLARYQVANLFLDTFLYGAGTTGMDALWAGLPLLTCPGETYASRFGASHLSALGMPELIAASPAEYEARAFHLATHLDELSAIRRKLAVQRLQAPLFRADRLVRQLEAAYKQAWGRHQAGLPPAHIEIH